MGRSRFDFLLSHRGADVLLEVKSCTLAGERVAMFPDAVTERGARHVRELAEISDRGTRTAVLFVVQWPHAEIFMPDFHTDPEFTRTLLACRRRVETRAVAVRWNRKARPAARGSGPQDPLEHDREGSRRPGELSRPPPPESNPGHSDRKAREYSLPKGILPLRRVRHGESVPKGRKAPKASQAGSLAHRPAQASRPIRRGPSDPILGPPGV